MRATVCPNMTLEALNGTWCWNNSEVMLRSPSTVTFNCTYELKGQNTTFTWWLNNKMLPGYTEKLAHIFIPSGESIVTCQGFIDASVNSSGNYINCTCTEMKSINVTVVGTSLHTF